jgi:four helix bundle protein
MFKRYDELEVYKLAYQAALQLHRASVEWPKYEQFGGIADQLRRSSKSICANLAEGLNKHASAAEEKRFLGIAMGSAEESQVWLNFTVDLGYMKKEIVETTLQDYRKISAMIAGLMKRRSI